MALSHEPSWTFLELQDVQPGEVVITDHQIVRSLVLLKSYAANDLCGCQPQRSLAESREPPCARCEAEGLIRAVTGEMQIT